VRWWPVRFVLGCWWLAQAAAVLRVAQYILNEYADFHPVSSGGQTLGIATRFFILFFASYLSTVFLLLALGFLGVGRPWLNRIYRLRFVIDLAIALVGLVGLRAAD
jgi:hypothetical protein